MKQRRHVMVNSELTRMEVLLSRTPIVCMMKLVMTIQFLYNEIYNYTGLGIRPTIPKRDFSFV